MHGKLRKTCFGPTQRRQHWRPRTRQNVWQMWGHETSLPRAIHLDHLAVGLCSLAGSFAGRVCFWLHAFFKNMHLTFTILVVVLIDVCCRLFMTTLDSNESLATLGTPLNYTLHCDNATFLATLGTNTSTVSSVCSSSETVWFMQWAGPCALGIGNIIVAAMS